MWSLGREQPCSSMAMESQTLNNHVSHLQNDLCAHTLRYAQNFILGILIICLW